ncbi:MAG TPA: glycosyltransferase [Thermoanaerobaculia bacterium]|jgi:glycosyltransferase involved in cell wall biosynthesis|nr:glycosyltransferase [Thermoanaerobaculia bacterium]
MRILLLAPHPFFSQRGTPIAERMLLDVLAAQGHEIDVLTLPEGEDPAIANIRVHRISAPAWTRGMRPGFSLKKLACDAVMLGACLARVRKSRYDVVHAVEESAFIALVCKWLFGVPYVYDMDSGLAQQMVDRFPGLRLVRGLLDAFERLAVRGSSGTLAVCGSLETQARACHPGGLVARLEDVSLLGTGSGGEGDVDLCPPDWRGDPIVLYVGNLQTYQGIDLLLAGFARALAQVPRARLVIVGGREERIAHYRREAGRLGIGESVHFAGQRPVERLGDCLRQAAVLVSPRIHGTNTPMKVYSYLDSGRPLLATRLPTHTQVLDDEVALLVEPEPGAMGRGIARLLGDEVLRERLAANARRFARHEFTPEAFQRKLLAFYDAVAERIARHDDDGETAGLEAQSPR